MGLVRQLSGPGDDEYDDNEHDSYYFYDSGSTDCNNDESGEGRRLAEEDC